jgi:hypothetical protein
MWYIYGGYGAARNVLWYYQGAAGTETTPIINIEVIDVISNGTGRVQLSGCYHAHSTDVALNESGPIQPFIINNTAANHVQYININDFCAVKNFDRFSRILMKSSTAIIYKVSGDNTWFFHADQELPGEGNVSINSEILRYASIDNLRVDLMPEDEGVLVRVLGVDANKKVRLFVISGSPGGAETDPIFEAWLLTNPLAGFLTEEADPVFQAWLLTDPIPDAQIQSDCNQADDTLKDFIKNKPSRIVELKIVSDILNPVIGDGKMIFCIPEELNGFSLISAHAFVTTAAAGSTLIQIRNVTTAQDMLSTLILIDSTEYSSYTSITPSVINPTYKQVSTGNLIAVDIDSVASASKGLGVILIFNK